MSFYNNDYINDKIVNVEKTMSYLFHRFNALKYSDEDERKRYFNIILSDLCGLELLVNNSKELSKLEVEEVIKALLHYNSSKSLELLFKLHLDNNFNNVVLEFIIDKGRYNANVAWRLLNTIKLTDEQIKCMKYSLAISNNFTTKIINNYYNNAGLLNNLNDITLEFVCELLSIVKVIDKNRLIRTIVSQKNLLRCIEIHKIINDKHILFMILGRIINSKGYTVFCDFDETNKKLLFDGIKDVLFSEKISVLSYKFLVNFYEFYDEDQKSILFDHLIKRIKTQEAYAKIAEKFIKMNILDEYQNNAMCSELVVKKLISNS